MIGVRVHEGSHCAHTAAPDADTADSLKTAEVLEDTVDIISLVVAEGDVLAF